ncbi:MAG: hypothetical protein R3346_01335 [Candidatus Spechtbacterales bacterium]|nr:hypothetical protein [Candidatus Spechtbacterales bacterium]
MNIDKLKKITNIIIGAYIVAGLTLFLGAIFDFNIFPGFYMPYLMGALAFVSVFLIILPGLILKPGDNPKKKRALVYLKASIAFGLIINGAGGLGLYKLYTIGIQYDKITHFVTPFIFTVALTYLLVNWYEKEWKYALIVSAIVVILGGFLWEVLEYVSDIFLGTHLFGGGSSEVIADTVGDIVANFLGVGVASFLIMRKNE